MVDTEYPRRSGLVKEEENDPNAEARPARKRILDMIENVVISFIVAFAELLCRYAGS